MSTDEREPAVTEHGTALERYSKQNVDEALKLLVLNGGDRNKTCSQLAEEGIEVSPDALRYWRDSAFLTRYHALRSELQGPVGEKIAGQAMERAMQADQASEKFLAKAVEKIEEIPAKDLAPAARAASQVLKENIEKAQLLRDKPTQITDNRSVSEMIAQLGKLGLEIRIGGNVVDGSAREIGS